MSKISLEFMQRFMQNLDSAIKAYVTLPHLGTGYGICTTAEITVEKAVTLSNYYLISGGTVVVKFTNHVPANATLNVNNRGAKPIYYRGSAIRDNIISATDTATFIYDGDMYHLINVDRAATNEENVLSSSDLIFSSALDTSYIQSVTVNAQLINSNLMLCSCELGTKSTTPSISFPSYNNSTELCFCRISNFVAKNPWWDGKLECGGTMYNLLISTGTVDNQQYLSIGLRNGLTISGQNNLRFSFVAYVERQ